MSSYLLDTTSNSSVTYGQGKYVASASMEAFLWTAWNAFDSTITSLWQPNTYNASGTYAGSVSTIDSLGNSYAGEWLQIQMPVSIILSSYTIFQNFIGNLPSRWSILGSRDGTNWTLVNSQTGTNFWTASPSSANFTVSVSQAYTYFRLVIQGTNSTVFPTIYQLILNGTEESLCVTSDAKVGVGIANPQRALEVAGDLVVSGTISGGAGMGSFRNRIINGDMRIAQRGTSAAVPSSGKNYLVDRFNIQTSISAGSITQYQNTLSVSDTPYQLGLKYASNVVVNSAVTASYVVPGYFVELESVQDFNWGASFGSPVTFSIWFKTNAPSGSQFNINISNYGYGTSSYNIPVIANSGVWQYITATIPPPPNGTTWVFPGTNGSIQIYIAPYNPGQLTASSSAWTSTYGLYGNYPWVSYAGTSIAFTGVQLEKGTVATPFEFRAFATELALCQRYYQVFGPGNTTGYNRFGAGHAPDTTHGLVIIPFQVPMRAAPTTFSNSAPNTFQINSGAAAPVATNISTGDASPTSAQLYVTVASGLTAGYGVICIGNGSTSAFVGFGAEL
jgi:hypothetical protein